MNSRKRQAQEPLLPLRSPKQPRRTLMGYNGGTPSPSEYEGILARYRRIGKDFTELLFDTVAIIIPSSTSMSKQRELFVPDDSADSDSSASSVSTPRQTPAPDIKIFSSDSDGSQGDIKTRPKKVPMYQSKPKSALLQELFSNQPRAFTSGRRNSSTQSTSRTPSDLFSTDDHSLLNDDTSLDSIRIQSTPKQQSVISSSTTSSTSTPLKLRSEPSEVLRSHVVPMLDNLNLTRDSSMGSSQISNASTLFSISQRASAPRPMQSSKGPKPKRVKNREHIHAKVYKANVVRQKLEQREELIRELYLAKRSAGFTSGLSDFKGLLDYQQQLRSIDLEGARHRHHPSSSFTTGKVLHTRALSKEDDQATFLRRTLDNARATLNSPKPPKPFSPGLDLLQIAQRTRDDDIEKRIRPVAPTSLPKEDNEAVDRILRKAGVVAEFAKERVSDSDLARLRPGQWLNDEIVNFYGAMLSHRSEDAKENPAISAGLVQLKGKKAAKPTPLLNVHYFSSFFWEKLIKEGYEKSRLARWTRKIDIFSKDAILIPVNHGNAHWTAAVINFRKKRFESYDSMGMAKAQVTRQLRSYINAEHENKKKKPFDFAGWEDYTPDDIPQQENGYDCGVFTCMFLEASARGEEIFCFSQKDMPYLRRRMIWEIGNAKLRGGHYS